MRKRISLLVFLLWLVGAGWNAAQAQTYLTDDKTGDLYFYNEEEGLLTEDTQLFANSEESEQFYVGRLIDPSNDYNTIIWHTAWTHPLDAGVDNYMTFHLNEARDNFVFSMVGSNWPYTYDTPDHVIWYGTNTPEDESSWEELLEMPDLIPASLHTTYPAFYTSPILRFSQAYSDFKMVIKSTVNMRLGANGVPYVSLARFQMYAPQPCNDPEMLLSVTIDNITDADLQFPVGTAPGYYPEDKVEAFNEALSDAQIGRNLASSAEEFTELRDNLRKAYAEVQASLIPVTEGYYRFVNAYPEFETQQGVQKAMNADVSGNLGWDTLNPEDASQLFHVTAASDSTWSIQNVATGDFIANKNADTGRILLTKTQQIGQVFEFLSEGQFKITNIENNVGYHTQNHQSGAGEWGYIVHWNSGINDCSAWFVSPETDETVIQTLIAKADASRDLNNINNVIDEAYAVIEQMIDYTPLITNANDGTEGCQFSSNAKEPNEGLYSNLIDGSTGTHFHSIYSSDGPLTDHNLQVDMLEPQKEFFFDFTGRSGSYHDTPTSFSVYVTNNAELYADANSSDDQWTKVADLSNRIDNISEAKYESPIFKLEEGARYFRMVVHNTTTAASGRANNFTGLPYFNLSEFMVYNTTPESTSPYWLINGMSDACEALKALISAEQEKLTAGTAAIEDTTAIYEAMRNVQALWIDLDQIDAELASALDSVSIAYNAAFGRGTVALLKDGSQLYANSEMSGFPVSNLLDPSDAYNKIIFHSVWGEGALEAGIDNYLQVHLNEAQSAIAFSMIGSSWAGTYDTPDDFVIMATNTPDEEGSWVEITELPDMIPAALHTTYPAFYTSPLIELGAAYTDIRFVVKKTVNMRGNSHGNIFFSLARFQVYGDADPADAQYYYVEGMKEAVDEMLALRDELAAHTKHTTSQQQVDQLRQDIQKVLDMIVDGSDMETLFATVQDYIDQAVVGTTVGSFASEDPINALKTALADAQASVNLKRPDPKQMNPATEKLNAAIATFKDSYIKVQPGKWYYLVNSSKTYDYCSGNAIYMQTCNTGANIYWGLKGSEDQEEADYVGNPYAVWRFVPIEGSEDYALQNMGTSHYLGAYTGNRGGSYLPKVADEPQPYKMIYQGRGGVSIVPVDERNTENYGLHAQQNGAVICLWNADYDYFSASCWTMVEADMDLVSIPMTMNTMRIQTLPFAVPEGEQSIMSLNDGVETFELSGIEQTDKGTLVKLAAKEGFEAGEPFIIIYGDTEAYDAENAEAGNLLVKAPEDITTVAGVANGLIGTLDDIKLEYPAYGYINENGLTVSEGGETIPAQRGYIDPKQSEDKQLGATLDILLEGVTMDGVKEVLENNRNLKGDLYSIDGKLLQKGATLNDIIKTQNRGFYIIGNQKIYKK